jgi:anti-sigma28 factor (negative regulator of flagellin synthesis)
MESTNGLRLTLNHDSIVNGRSGEVQAPSEYVANLRELELSIQRDDADIARYKYNLKVAKEVREKNVAALRTAIREGTVLPLLEAESEEEA